MRTTHFWNNLHQVRSKSKVGAKKPKGNCLRSPMPEGGEPLIY